MSDSSMVKVFEKHNADDDSKSFEVNFSDKWSCISIMGSKNEELANIFLDDKQLKMIYTAIGNHIMRNIK